MYTVNKITARMENNEVYVGLYNNKNKIVEISGIKLDLPPFDEKFANLTIYLSYCREYARNLIENGGIKNFTFVEKQVTKKTSIHYKDEVINRVKHALDTHPLVSSMRVLSFYSYNVIKFKNGKINKAVYWTEVEITSTDNKTIKMMISVMVNSGQFSNPKTILCHEILNFNMSNITRCFKNYDADGYDKASKHLISNIGGNNNE